MCVDQPAQFICKKANQNRKNQTSGSKGLVSFQQFIFGKQAHDLLDTMDWKSAQKIIIAPRDSKSFW